MGIQKRMAAAGKRRAGSAVNEPPVQSLLCRFLLNMFAWGEFSPQRVQHIASLCLDDMVKVRDEGAWFVELEELAAIGSHGNHSNNAHRDLMMKVKNLSKLQEPFMETFTFAEPFGECPQLMMLPHETFAHIYHNYPEVWSKSVMPNTSKLHEFWTAMEHNPQMLGHPLKSRANYSKWAVPLSFHGDGVPLQGIGKIWVKLMTVFSFGSLLATGLTRDVQFLIWGCFDKLLQTGEVSTLDEFWMVLRWSFYWLWRGVWPDQHWNRTEKYLGCLSSSMMLICLN
jgi:hypothetical protein